MLGTAAKVFSLVIIGGIVADIWAHPAGTKSAASGGRSLEVPALQAVSGQNIVAK